MVSLNTDRVMFASAIAALLPAPVAVPLLDWMTKRVERAIQIRDAEIEHAQGQPTVVAINGKVIVIPARQERKVATQMNRPSPTREVLPQFSPETQAILDEAFGKRS